MVANVVADERTNAVLVSGEPNSRQRIIAMIKQLDRQQAVQGNTKVIYLKYAKAADLVEVLTGISSSLQSDKQSAEASGRDRQKYYYQSPRPDQRPDRHRGAGRDERS